MTKRNEVSYYKEIQNYIEDQLKSNFLIAKDKELFVFWGIGELKTELLRIINENEDICSCVKQYANKVAPLSLDIFGLVTDGKNFEIIILEVKLVKSAGLINWSQLVGYCLVSGAKYGLLLNIDNGASPRLQNVLQDEKHLSEIKILTDENIKVHKLGFMQWNSITKNFEYSCLSHIKSISDLTNDIIKIF